MNTVSQLSEGKQGHSERALEQLPPRTQIRLMRQIALDALSAYDLPPLRLTLIAHMFNTTFRVDTATGQRYMLRINRAGAPTVESVGAELDWLIALRRDTPLEVPAPVPARSGAHVQVASTPNLAQPYVCVLFRWLPGRRLRSGLTPEHMERVGGLMASLQEHASHWGPPPGFARGRVDWPVDAASGMADPFAPKVIAYIHRLVAETLSLAEAEQVTSALARVAEVGRVLGHGPDAVGPIHADLHYGNLLFAKGTVRAIDFDDCGFGPYLYDPAVMLSAIQGWDGYPALRQGLLQGYRRLRPLPAEHEAYLDVYIALRQLQDALWVLETPTHPAIHEDWAALARRSLEPVPDLLGGL